MALAIEIPAPRAGDSAKVVSSLENAALFGRIGDGEEALRWLQRAAESASESGDDERTLALARTASELSSTLRPASGAPVNGERRLPTPPPRSRPAAEATPSRPVPVAPPPAEPAALLPEEVAPRPLAPVNAGATDEPTLLLTRPAQLDTKRPLEPVTKSSVAPRPPPPSSRPQAARPPQLGTHPLPKPATEAPLPPSVTPAPASVSPSSTSARRPARVRQAARVSVEKSKTEPGLYLVRVLDEGQSPEPGRTEALLVSVDPGVGLF